MNAIELADYLDSIDFYFAGSDMEDRFREVARLLRAQHEALEPFAVVDWTDDEGWKSTGCPNDRICDWFGPADFRGARRAYEGEP